MSCIHCTKIKQFYNRSSLLKLRRVIGWGCELLDDLSAYSGCRLFSLQHRAVPKITLNKKDHLVIPHQNVVCANVIKPPLERCLDAGFILVCTSTGRCQRRWYCRYKGFGIRGYQVIGQLHEFGVGSSDIAELGSSKLWKVGLRC
jgi:hypothetical protein